VEKEKQFHSFFISTVFWEGWWASDLDNFVHVEKFCRRYRAVSSAVGKWKLFSRFSYPL